MVAAISAHRHNARPRCMEQGGVIWRNYAEGVGGWAKTGVATAAAAIVVAVVVAMWMIHLSANKNFFFSSRYLDIVNLPCC